jgi:hypothetical protein
MPRPRSRPATPSSNPAGRETIAASAELIVVMNAGIDLRVAPAGL